VVDGAVNGKETNNIPQWHHTAEMKRAVGAVCWLIVAIMAMPVIAAPAMADGFSYRYVTAEDAWRTATERAQFGIINFNAGQEKMVLSIQVEAADLSSAVTRTAWIFPVPSDPQDVSLDHLALTPRMEGEPINRQAAKAVSEDYAWAYCILGSQLYTVPFMVPLLLYTMVLGIGGPGGTGGYGDQVMNYDRMEKYGVTSEVISAESSNALYNYVQGKGIDLPDTAWAILVGYIGKNYSLVLSQITDLDSFRVNAQMVNRDGVGVYVMGIEVDFPSKDIFFPLKLTSVYENAQIPIVVQVIGNVKPTVYPASNSDLRMTVDYSIQERYDITDAPNYMQYGSYFVSQEDIQQTKEFFTEQLDAQHLSYDWRPLDTGAWMTNIHYTTVTFNGSASALNEDLWMSDVEPLAVTGANIGTEYPLLPIILIFVLVSCLSGLITGAWLYRGKRSNLFVIVGLANLLTLAGVWMAYNRIIKPRIANDPMEPKRSFVWRYSLVYLTLSGLAYGLIYIASRM